MATMTPRAAARALVFLVLLGAAGAVSLKRATEEPWNFDYNLHVLPSQPNACKERETCLDVGADQLPLPAARIRLGESEFRRHVAEARVRWRHQGRLHGQQFRVPRGLCESTSRPRCQPHLLSPRLLPRHALNNLWLKTARHECPRRRGHRRHAQVRRRRILCEGGLASRDFRAVR